MRWGVIATSARSSSVRTTRGRRHRLGMGHSGRDHWPIRTTASGSFSGWFGRSEVRRNPAASVVAYRRKSEILSQCHTRADWNNSTRFPEGSTDNICIPAAPVTISFRKRTPATAPPRQPSHRRQCECGSTRRDRPLLALEIWLECRGEPGMHPVVRLLRPGIPCALDRLIGLKTAGLSECRATAGYRQRSHRTRA